MSFVTQRPLTASVSIIKSGTSYYNTTSTLGSTEFRLLKGMVALGSGGKASTADLIVEDNNKSLFSTFTVGATVYVDIGKTSSTFLTVFGGIIEEAESIWESANISSLHIRANDWTTKALNKTVKRYDKHQKRDTDGKLDRVDASNMYVTDLIVDLMNRTDNTVYQNGQNSGIGADITTSSGLILASRTSIPDVAFEYKQLSDCLRELFDYLRYTWWVDPNAKLNARPDTLASDSGVTLDSSTIIAMSITDDITETTNRVFVVGSDDIKVGVTSSTKTGGPKNTSTVYLAQKFIPTADDLRYVQFYIGKVGAPANLTIGLFQDSSNSPSGAMARVSELNKERVSSTAAAWYQVDINTKVTTDSAYWVVLFRSASATEYYEWYTDAGSGGTTAQATDGLTWTVFGATSTFAHQIWFANPIVAPVEDIPSTSSYGVREAVLRQPEVDNFDDAFALGKGLLASLSKKKQMLELQTYVPDTVLIPGNRVTIKDSRIVTTTYLITDISYELQEHTSYVVDIKAMRYR